MVADKTGAFYRRLSLRLWAIQTELTRTQKTNESGIYDFVNLPIGTYTLTFARDGFETQKIPSITVQANRTGDRQHGVGYR